MSKGRFVKVFIVLVVIGFAIEWFVFNNLELVLTDYAVQAPRITSFLKSLATVIMVWFALILAFIVNVFWNLFDK